MGLVFKTTNTVFFKSRETVLFYVAPFLRDLLSTVQYKCIDVCGNTSLLKWSAAQKCIYNTCGNAPFFYHGIVCQCMSVFSLYKKTYRCRSTMKKEGRLCVLPMLRIQTILFWSGSDISLWCRCGSGYFCMKFKNSVISYRYISGFDAGVVSSYSPRPYL
jgi:hypothetical protein